MSNQTQMTEKFLQTYASALPVFCCPQLRVYQADDIYTLWAAWEKHTGTICPPPFWAVVWPAAAVCCRYIFDHPELVRRKRILDCGCGGASVAIAAALHGAEDVVANDIDTVALDVAACNAELNGVPLHMIGDDLTLKAPASDLDIIFVADMFYEKGPSQRMMQWLVKARSNGTRVILADGGRNFAPRNGFHILESRDVEVDARVEGPKKRNVQLLSMH